MGSEAPVKQSLASLGEVSLRRGWLRERLRHWPATRAAQELNTLALESEFDALARQALLTVVSLLVREADSDIWPTLLPLARTEGLISLQRLLDWPTVTVLPNRKPVEPRIPDYGTGRELTLGERRSLARRPNRRFFDKLLRDPHPWVIGLLLDNPKLTEDDVVQLTTKRPAQVHALEQAVKCDRWLCRSRVRHSIVLNPGCPYRISVPLVHLCNRKELKEVKESAHLPDRLRALAGDLFERRPPLTAHGGEARELQ